MHLSPLLHALRTLPRKVDQEMLRYPSSVGGCNRHVLHYNVLRKGRTYPRNWKRSVMQMRVKTSCMFWTSSDQVPYHERGCLSAAMQYPTDKYTLSPAPSAFTFLTCFAISIRDIDAQIRRLMRRSASLSQIEAVLNISHHPIPHDHSRWLQYRKIRSLAP